MTTETVALKRYNSLFDNVQYSAIAEHIADDLRVPRDSARVSDVMNEITNVALSLCNHSHYADAWLRLATFCGQDAISIPTIDAIYSYLLIYQQSGDNRAEDFELTAKALLNSYRALDALRSAVSCTNGVHGWRGRMAYDLLAASDFLVQAAVQLLLHGNLSYIREKLQSGVRRITGALHEGTRHSESPEMFDFNES
jgi:hypothetical protein